MIPPLLMDIESHHIVLDMCAAPGSKTAQLVEMVHNAEEANVSRTSAGEGGESISVDGETGGRATGLVIANDSDYKRSHMLIHQTKRLNSPNLIVTNHDATMYPSLLTSHPDDEVKTYLKFDRILADVPCTGDGTARKNYNVWKDWNPHSAFNLHAIQIRILVRGLQMLKVGGRLVYSTCSMNPIENEAVIQAAIDRCGGLEKVEIVDVSDRLPALKRKPGIKGGWRVMDKDQTWYSNYQEVLKDDEGKETRVGRITRSMFPSETNKANDDPTRIPLERCVRVYPHQQDTGGFFITVLYKKEEIRAIKPEDTKQQRIAALVWERKQASAAAALENAEVSPVDAQLRAEEAEETKAQEAATKAADAALVSFKSEATPPPPPSPGKRKLDSPAPAPAVKKLKAEATTETTLTSDVTITDASTDIPPEIIVPTPEAPSTETPKPFDFRGKRKGGPPPEEPFKYLPHDHEVLQRIYEFYDLSPRFPKTCFMVRNAEALPVRAIYFTSRFAKTILECNEGRGVKFVHCGVKAFMKQDVQDPDTCPWRIQSEGLSIIAPWIGEARVVHATKKETVHALLRELFPKVGTTENGEKVNEGGFAKRNSIEEISDQVSNLGMGCCILKVKKTEGEFDDDMILPLWKSRHSCNLMLPKDERRYVVTRDWMVKNANP